MQSYYNTFEVPANLANNSNVFLKVYTATIRWNGETQAVNVVAAGRKPFTFRNTTRTISIYPAIVGVAAPRVDFRHYLFNKYLHPPTYWRSLYALVRRASPRENRHFYQRDACGFHQHSIGSNLG